MSHCSYLASLKSDSKTCFHSDIVTPGELTSVAISSDSRFAIVSHAPNVRTYLSRYTIF